MTSMFSREKAMEERARLQASSSLRPRSAHERGSATSASSSRLKHPATKSSPLHNHTPAILAEQPHRDNGSTGESLSAVVSCACTRSSAVRYCSPAAPCSTRNRPDRSSRHGMPIRVAGTTAIFCEASTFPAVVTLGAWKPMEVPSGRRTSCDGRSRTECTWYIELQAGYMGLQAGYMGMELQARYSTVRLDARRGVPLPRAHASLAPQGRYLHSPQCSARCRSAQSHSAQCRLT
eukprot:scaffold43690_cov69-Phaeocystis_antarctica.AAC.2